MSKLYYAICPHCKGNVIVPSYHVGNANAAVLVDDQGRYQGTDEQASCSDADPDAFACDACGREIPFDIMVKGGVYRPPRDEVEHLRSELEKLRSSLVYIARMLNIEHPVPGTDMCIQKADTSFVSKAALVTDRGWNRLAAGIVKHIEDMRRDAKDMYFSLGGNRR